MGGMLSVFHRTQYRIILSPDLENGNSQRRCFSARHPSPRRTADKGTEAQQGMVTTDARRPRSDRAVACCKAGGRRERGWPAHPGEDSYRSRGFGAGSAVGRFGHWTGFVLTAALRIVLNRSSCVPSSNLFCSDIDAVYAGASEGGFRYLHCLLYRSPIGSKPRWPVLWIKRNPRICTFMLSRYTGSVSANFLINPDFVLWN
jgi:hypothetical protein